MKLVLISSKTENFVLKTEFSQQSYDVSPNLDTQIYRIFSKELFPSNQFLANLEFPKGPFSEFYKVLILNLVNFNFQPSRILQKIHEIKIQHLKNAKKMIVVSELSLKLINFM